MIRCTGTFNRAGTLERPATAAAVKMKFRRVIGATVL
jgi:hypothetical protein